jgi:hypothetical protein
VTRICCSETSIVLGSFILFAITHADSNSASAAALGNRELSGSAVHVAEWDAGHTAVSAGRLKDDRPPRACGKRLRWEPAGELSAQLRAAEDRLKELEAKVRHHEDRADRAKEWLKRARGAFRARRRIVCAFALWPSCNQKRCIRNPRSLRQSRLLDDSFSVRRVVGVFAVHHGVWVLEGND